VLHTQPERAAQALELWEGLQQDERVGAHVRAATARVRRLVGGSARDEL